MHDLYIAEILGYLTTADSMVHLHSILHSELQKAAIFGKQERYGIVIGTHRK